MGEKGGVTMVHTHLRALAAQEDPERPESQAQETQNERDSTATGHKAPRQEVGSSLPVQGYESWGGPILDGGELSNQEKKIDAKRNRGKL